MPRGLLRCSVPGCSGINAARRGGADIMLCYEHGKLLADSKTRQKVKDIELAWALASRPIESRMSCIVQEPEPKSPEPQTPDIFCSELLDDIARHGG